MCCIICCFDSKPSGDLVNKIAIKNSDGIGISWFKDDLAFYKKGLYSYESSKFIEKLELPFVMHFRAASMGMSKSNLLCHPFEVKENSPLSLQGNAKQLFVHNGTLSGYKILLATADLEENEFIHSSDSRALAMILSKLKDLKKQERLLKTMNGRFVLMDAPTQKFKLFGGFKWHSDYAGMKFSNLDWEYQTQSYFGHYHNCSNNNNNNNQNNSTYKKEDFLTEEERKTYKLHLEYENVVQTEKCSVCGSKLTEEEITTMYMLGYTGENSKCESCLVKSCAPKQIIEATETAEYAA